MKDLIDQLKHLGGKHDQKSHGGKGGGISVKPGDNMSDKDLSGADLSGKDLSGVDFTGANLRSANLQGAKLKGANFLNADLRGTNFRGADLTGAWIQKGRASDAVAVDLKGARVLKDKPKPGSKPGYVSKWKPGEIPAPIDISKYKSGK